MLLITFRPAETKPMLSVAEILTNIMEVTLKQFFSIGDGRLSTGIGEVYKMLNYIFDEDFSTHQLPTAMTRLKELNPKWFENAVSVIDEIKAMEDTNDFEAIMKVIDFGYSDFKIKLEKIESEFSFTNGLERFL